MVTNVPLSGISNKSAAKGYYWPRGGAVGQRLFEGSEERPDADAFTIVGAVGAVKQAELTQFRRRARLTYAVSQRRREIGLRMARGQRRCAVSSCRSRCGCWQWGQALG